MIKAPKPGYIENILIESGKYVKAGTKLFQIYSKDIKAEMQKKIAESQLEKSHLDKITKLYNQGFISKDEFEKNRESYISSVSDMQATLEQLDLLTVKAPFSGYLGIKKINTGDYVAIGEDLIDIQGTEPDKY